MAEADAAAGSRHSSTDVSNPPDTSSPRATLRTFVEAMDAVYAKLADPGSEAADSVVPLERAARTLDMSGFATEIRRSAAIETALRAAAAEGPLAGYLAIGLKAVLLDGAHHPVDSSAMAFANAARAAFRLALWGRTTGGDVLVFFGFLVLRPPFACPIELFTRLLTQQNKVVGCSEPWVSGQFRDLFTLAAFKAVLQFPNFFHRDGEAFWNRRASHLLFHNAAHGAV